MGKKEDIKSRINKARHAFNSLQPINRPVTKQQDADLRYHCQVSSTLRPRSLVGNEDQHTKASNIHQ
jgi:hypothetical protein